MSASLEYTEKKERSYKDANFENKEMLDSLRELTKKIDDMRTEIEQLTFDSFDESQEEDQSHEDLSREEEFKANPWIWSGSRRPRPVPYSYVQECLKDPPSNIKSMLQKVLVQDIAISNWIHKRPVLISAQQSIERVCLRFFFFKLSINLLIYFTYLSIINFFSIVH